MITYTEAEVAALAKARHERTITRADHVIVVARGNDDDGLIVECAWCGDQVGFTFQSGRLDELNEMAEAHFVKLGL